jgi:hypothetical protein
MPNSQAELSYQVCPIILTGGIAGQIPGGMLPMMNLWSQNNSLGLPFSENDLDDAFAAFNVLPGGTLVAQTIGKYPFANQWVAANAVIREPLTLSMIMDTPMRGPNAWSIKQAVFTALKATLDRHNNIGGMYTVATPAYIYENLVMTSLTDNSRGNNSLPQNAWRFDFERPLVALSDLGEAQNQLMQKISNQTPTTGALAGIQPGLTAADTTLTATYPVAGGLSGGNPPPITTPALSSSVFNYPALSNLAAYAYRGVA